MLVELAIADAYGAGFEYANEMIKFNDLSKYVQHPRHKGIRPGMYTDDTAMSIAIAELIVSGEKWTPLNIANKFVECFKRDWRDGYARGFQMFLESINSGQEFLDKIKPYSDKSGAAMRACPIGIFSGTDTVIRYAIMQAKLTHNTKDGIEAAVVAALITHFFISDLFTKNWEKNQIGEWVNACLDAGPGGFKNKPELNRQHDWNEPWSGKVKSKGWMSVRAAITAIKRNDKLSDLLKDCISFTGDTDTVATIAIAAASCSAEYEKDIPQYLIDTLENGIYGREYLSKLNNKLFELNK